MPENPNTALLHYSAAPVVGGVEAVMHAQVKQFLQHGYPVSVIAGRGEAEAQPEGAKFIQLPAMDSQREEITRMSAELNQGRVPAEFEALTDQLTHDLQPVIEPYTHVIAHNILSKHFNLPLTAALMRLLDQGRLHHLIAWSHDFTWTSSHSREQVHPGYPWDLLRTYDSRITYVTISRQRQKEWAGLLGCPVEKIHVVYNGVDPKELLGLSDQVAEFARRVGLWQAQLIMLMPVRVTQAKNIEFAIQVARAIKERGLGIRLIVSGPPDPHDSASMEYFEDLIAQVKRLDLQEEVRFVFNSGPNTGEAFILSAVEIGELMRISDLILMPSHREGYGMPVLEAGLSGIPFFSTPIPAAEEIGLPDVRIFQRDASPEGVAGLILNSFENDPIHALKLRVRSRYTWEELFERSVLPLIDPERWKAS